MVNVWARVASYIMSSTPLAKNINNAALDGLVPLLLPCEGGARVFEHNFRFGPGASEDVGA